MQLQHSINFDPEISDGVFESVPSRPAVFALFPDQKDNFESPPYLSRTSDLRRRLTRLLGKPGSISRRLNLRELARRIEYSPVGSAFEAQWLLYILNKHYYPKLYRQRSRLRPPVLLKLNLSDRFPRLFPTRRIARDGATYYGPFRSRVEAERWSSEFLDLFKIRRCVEDLSPDPTHPGCIYSQMHMCLAPCFAGCTDEEYQSEVSRVVAFLDVDGHPLVGALERERAQAAESLEFEQAAKIHRRLEKVHELLRLKPDLVRNLRELHAVVVERGAEQNSVVFFRVTGGELRGPAKLCFDENVPSPVPLDQRLRQVLESLDAGSDRFGESASIARNSAIKDSFPGQTRSEAPTRSSAIPPWEHLSLLARWYYSSFRQGELVMLPASQQIPHARLIRICRKLLAAGS